jgi:hypothetical protein
MPPAKHISWSSRRLRESKRNTRSMPFCSRMRVLYLLTSVWGGLQTFPFRKIAPLAPETAGSRAKSKGSMDQFWTEIFKGTVDGRPVVAKVWDDGEGRAYRVETNYNNDQIIGDVSGAIGFPVSASDKMNIDAMTPDELELSLVEDAGFSQESAKDIVRQVRSPTI